MKRSTLAGFLFLISMLLTQACNISMAPGTEKINPLRFDTSGDRISHSGEYQCNTVDSVILIIDENGVATLSTTGPVFVDYINCVLDPSGFEATYTIVGLADPEKQLITFTSCNDGAFDASGSISYMDIVPYGNVSCLHATGEDSGELAIMLWVPSER